MGVYEFATGYNLLPFKGSVLIREGERRVNGPFASDSSFAIISLLLCLFVSIAPRIFQLKLDASGRLVHLFIILLLAFSSAMPVFRTLIIALAGGFVVLLFANSEKHFVFDSKLHKQVMLPVFSLVLMALLVIGFSEISGSTSMSKRLLSFGSAYGRLATWETTSRVAAENPLLGVGLDNYSDYFKVEADDEDGFFESAFETKVATTPHSNFLWIAAELGLAGLIPYIIANVLLLITGLRGLSGESDIKTRSAAACMLALLVGYTISGLTLQSGAYSDLNLVFFFLMGIMVQNIRRYES
jgi:O-antigen ligase